MPSTNQGATILYNPFEKEAMVSNITQLFANFRHGHCWKCTMKEYAVV